MIADNSLCGICGKPDPGKVFNEKAPIWMRIHACIYTPKGEPVKFVRCQDRSCPRQQTCVRYDPRYMPDPHTSYFGQSPRARDECAYYAADTPKPLTTDWPKDREHE